MKSKRRATMTPSEFQEAQIVLNHTNERLSIALGLTPRTITGYRSGTTPIPKHIGLIMGMLADTRRGGQVRQTCSELSAWALMCPVDMSDTLKLNLRDLCEDLAYYTHPDTDKEDIDTHIQSMFKRHII